MSIEPDEGYEWARSPDDIDRIAELEAENEKLRERENFYRVAADGDAQTVEDLRAEVRAWREGYAVFERDGTMLALLRASDMGSEG